MDVSELSDDELLAELKARGVNVGPILDSTRKVYQRKLQRLIAEENGSEGYVVQQEEEVDEEQDDYDSANADTQPVEYIDQPTYRTGSPSRQQRSSPARQQRSSPARSTTSYRPESGDDLSRHYGENVTLTRREIRTTSSTSQSHTTSMRTQSQPSTTQIQAKPKAKKSGLSICVQVTIFLIVAVLIYLVIMNMEPAAKDPLKGIDV